MLRPRIVIIGAGVSGLSAARKLIENGFLNTTILEAEPRIGGRIKTIDFDGKNIELGAQWCHGQTNNIVYELTKDFNVFGQSKNAYVDLPFYTSSGDSIDPKLGNRCLEIFYGIVFDEERLKRETGSLGDYFVRRYEEMIDLEFCDANDLEIARKLVPWFHGMTLGYDAGKSWFEISAEGSTHYELCDGDPLLNWKNYGFKTLLEIIMKSFPDESKSLPIRDKIELNKKVVRINWNDEIEIECSDGTIYNTDHVIVTTSLGVLKETHKVLFNPELPEAKRTAIENLGFGTVNKIFLKFPEAFWKDEDIGFNFIWENPEDFKKYPWLESVFGFYVVDNDPKTLLGWSVGEQTEAFENISDNELIDGCAFALNKFLGKFYVIPHPIKATRSKWSSNPNFRGSYSFRSVKTDEKNTSAEQLGTPIKNSLGNLALLFAGEATHEHFYSTVHGAFESGFREAQRIIELYKDPKIMQTKVAIVGAGLASLGATKTFLDANFEDFLILEATDRVGGRVNTIKLNESVLELGAQWLHDSDNYLYKLAEENNLISERFSEEGLGLYIRNDGYIYEEFFVKKIDFAVGKILEDCERFVNTKVYPKSLGDYLIEKFGEFVNNSEIESDLAYELLDWHIRFQIIDNSCLNLYKVSAKDWGKYSCFGKDGQKHFNIKNGYQSLIDLLTEKIPENKIKLNHPVTSITQNGNHIIIKCQFDRTIICDNLILTPSIGVLKQNLISFEPDLPEEYRKCVRSYGFHGIGKIFLVFSEKWWKADGFQLVWKKGTVLPEEKRWLRSISGFDNVLNQASVLVGWIGGEGIETVEKINEDLVGRECVDLLRKFLRNGDIPYPVKTIRTTWFSSPYIKGGYSHTTPSNDESNTGSSNLLKPIEVNGNSRIRFAGEAVHENHFSTTHGAFQSGEIAANELLKNIQKHKL